MAYQVDSMVALLGRWADNRLTERDEAGSHPHTLDSLLGDGPAGGAQPSGPAKAKRYRSFLNDG